MTIYFPESSIAFLREGYTFISRRCDKFGTDVFRTRLMLRPIVCLRGAEAAEFFYDGGRCGRARAMPRSAQHLLQDAGSVQSLEVAAHHHRKQLFLALTDRDSVTERLGRAFDPAWRAALKRWQPGGELVLHDELRRILTAAACLWAGVPADGQAPPLDCMSARTSSPPASSIIRLSSQILGPGEDAELECFAQEVRRYYPFFPFISGTVREQLEWNGHIFGSGQ